MTDTTVQIASAIEEQSVVSEQVSQNIERISGIAISCEESGQKTTLLTAELLKQLSDQESLVLQFKH